MDERFVKNKDVTDGGSRPDKFKLKFSDWILIVLVIGIFFFLNTAVITRQDEYSMIIQFQEIVRVDSRPGLTFKLPFIQRVEKREQKILFYDLTRSEVITSDKKTMIVDSYVLWRITDPINYYRSLSGVKSIAEARIDAVVYNAIKNTISSMTQDEIIVSRDGKIQVTQIEVEVESILLENADEEDSEVIEVVEIKSLTDEIASNLIEVSDYGIKIITVEVKALDLPESNKDAVYNRMISEREKVATLYKSEGESEAQMIRNQADREVSVMLSQAKADAAMIIAQGEAEYMQILSTAYNDAERSEFYEFVRALEAAKIAYNNRNGNILMLDKDSPLAKIFYDFSPNNENSVLTE
jgi:membrane protease subunit HflC